MRDRFPAESYLTGTSMEVAWGLGGWAVLLMGTEVRGDRSNLGSLEVGGSKVFRSQAGSR